MALTSERDKLGPYEILALIGGGMGEVYRAAIRGSGRDVAIKVSAAQFTERFEREARAVAALNHPNICTLYDVGPNYLVMSGVGRRRATAWPAAACHCAEATPVRSPPRAAHQKGITSPRPQTGQHQDQARRHRQSPRFRLAKVPDARRARLTRSSPTLAWRRRAGVILGTAAYMAPEQARGKPVDSAPTSGPSAWCCTRC